MSVLAYLVLFCGSIVDLKVVIIIYTENTRREIKSRHGMVLT